MTPEEVIAKVAAAFPGVDRAAAAVKEYSTLQVGSQDLRVVVSFLKDSLGFSYLDMVTAVDWKGPIDPKGFVYEGNPNVFLPEGATPQSDPPGANPAVKYRESFELVYCLSNLGERLKVFLRVEIPRGEPKAPSLVPLFAAADWQEREIFDLYGIHFEGHPNLKKILTPEFIAGHPLRKDYVHVKDRFD